MNILINEFPVSEMCSILQVNPHFKFMSKEIVNPHDKLIKQLLSQKELAIDFFKEALPRSLVSHINFETLTPLDTSFISQTLKASYSDLVWSVQMNDRHNLKISMLLEHKSYADPNTAFQLLEYLACGYLKQCREKKKPEPIVPILYYHGKHNWKFRSLESFFQDYPDSLKAYLPTFLTEHINLHDFSAEELLKFSNGLISSALMIQKYFHYPQRLSSHILSILEKLRPYLLSNHIEPIFAYLEETGLEDSVLEEAVKNLPNDMSTRVMSLREQLFSKGREAGIKEGIAEGISKGKQEGIIEERARSVIQTILNTYDAGIDLPTIRTITGESEEKILHILKKNQRVI